MLRLAAMLGLLSLPARAGAHPAVLHLALRRSEPASGVVVAAPARISLWFTAKPERAFTRIRLAGPNGEIALDPPVAETGNAVHARIPRSLEPGDYRVTWQTASADGHPIRGEFTFAVVAPGVSVVPSTLDTTAHAGHDPAPPARRDDSGFRTARFFEFAALLTVLGTLGFRHGVLPPLAARGVSTADAADRARRLGLSVLFLYAIAAVVRLYTQSAAVAGPGSAFDPSTVRQLLTQTLWGAGWSAGVLGAVVLIAGWLISKRSVTLGTPLALTGALGMVMSPALSGHAAASDQFILSVTLDMLHVIAAGVWLGGLAMVLFAGIPAMLRLGDGNVHAAVGALVNSFHPVALFCAPLAVLSGAGMSWLRLGRLDALWTTDYGRTLLPKVVLVGLVAGMGAYNSLRARRRLGDDDGVGTRRFRGTASLELALGAIVLIITTFLVVTPTPREIGLP
jgi:putative copper export protein/methionine-rich copper-binding protein CopC